MKDDEICVVFCNPEDAVTLINHEEAVKDSLVITPVLKAGELVLVSKEEFLRWLKDKTGVWIPVSEKPHPDNPRRVHVQLSNGWIITAYYDSGHWYAVPAWDDKGNPIEEDVFHKIEAWCEMIEPYEPEERE